MADLKLKFAVGRHSGWFKSIFEGQIKPEGIELDASVMSYDKLFWQVPNVNDIDVAELSLTGYMWGIQHGKQWIAIPVFPGWVFACHTETLCRTDAGIEKPQDLKGKRVGVPEYAVTAIVWIRHAFETRYGVRPEDIHWFEERPADYSHYRPMGYKPPAPVQVDIIPKEKRLCDMLMEGELDAVTRYFGRPENVREHPGDRSHMRLNDLARQPQIKWLFADRKAAAIEFHKQIGFLQPIHCVLIKKEIVAENPWVAMSLFTAFSQSMRMATQMDFVSPHSYSLSKQEQAEIIGHDFLPAGLKAHQPAIITLLDLCYQQGYVSRGRPFSVEEFFHPSTLDT